MMTTTVQPITRGLTAIVLRRALGLTLMLVLGLAGCGGGSSGSETDPGSDPTPVAPTFTGAPSNQSVIEPAAASWTVIVSGTPAPTLQWQQSSDAGVTWVDIPGATAATYTLPATVRADDGKRLRVVATNSAGSATSTVASLAVAPATPPDVGDVDARFAAIGAVEGKLKELTAQALPPADRIAAIATFMAARPEYAATGIDAESLSATGVFRDGRLHLVTLNFTPEPAAMSATSPQAPATVAVSQPRANAASARALATPAGAAGAEIPASSYARLIQAFGPGYRTQASINDAKTYLTSKGWKLRTVADGDARVETLRQVVGDGLFYINAHGGRVSQGVDPAKEPDGKLYAIDSSTLKDTTLEKVPQYADDLATKRIVYFTAPNGFYQPDGTPISDTRYGITRYFVEKYWSFGPNAVVLVNACFSALNAEFVNTVKSKGAGVYLGWTGNISEAAANNSLRYLIDGMVGANKFMPKSPAQRAFPYDLVLADMAKTGYDSDVVSGSKLTASVEATTAGPPMLAPSIREMFVDERAGTLRLEGGFGTLEGKVTVGGTPVAAKWAADAIEVTLPSSGSGSSGDVQVTTRDGVKSNLRQLTEWTMSLHYKSTAPSGLTGLLLEGTSPLRFRADVDGHRKSPGSLLTYPQREMYATADSGLTLTGSGSRVDGQCTATLSGSGKFLSALPLGTTATGLLLANAIKMDSGTRQGAFGLGFGNRAPTPPFKVTFSGTGPNCGASVAIAPTSGLMEGFQNFPASTDSAVEIPLAALQITFNAAFVLLGRNYADPSTGNTLSIQWSDVTPSSPPRDDIDSGR